MKGNLTNGQSVKKYTCCSFGIEEEMAKGMIIMIHDLKPKVWLDGHRLRRGMFIDISE